MNALDECKICKGRRHWHVDQGLNPRAQISDHPFELGRPLRRAGEGALITSRVYRLPPRTINVTYPCSRREER